MNTKRFTLIRPLAYVFGLVTLLMLPSLVMALVQGEYYMIRPFLVPMIIGFVPALSAVLFIRKAPSGFRPRDGILLVFLTWVFASLVGSLPYQLSPENISFSDAVFESSCSFATTGATTLYDIEALPRSLLLWRSMSHWAGGMGIILLTVALMPLLGVGGFQLIKAEVPGPDKERLTPRITETAKVLWGVYCIFTVILAFLYKLGGMELFDAVCHSFTIMSTGGVSTKNAGFSFFNSVFIDWVTVIFMLLGALNFNLYYRIIRGKYRDLLYNTESRVYLLIFIIAVLVITVNLIPQYGSFTSALRFGSFQTASILSTAGSVRTDYTTWPFMSQTVLFCLMFIGGCSGSTAGGIKVIRYVVLFKQTLNEVRRTLYPKGVFSIQLNRKVGRKDIVYGVAGFVFLYFIVVVITALVTTASGYDIFSSLNVAVSITGNIGSGFSAVGPFHNFGVFPDHLKLFYSLVMIAGRLELWTVFILFTPAYWKG
jgi:trk system potassium uptake protein TrkH